MAQNCKLLYCYLVDNDCHHHIPSTSHGDYHSMITKVLALIVLLGLYKFATKVDKPHRDSMMTVTGTQRAMELVLHREEVGPFGTSTEVRPVLGSGE